MGWKTFVIAKNDYENPSDCNIPYCDHYYDVNFSRSPLKKENIGAYRELKRIIDGEYFDIIHCHTPVGGALTRIAARESRKKGTRVFYTAHGFHFYKGAPLLNWILYYPIEKHLSKDTDVLITINHEDYEIAKTKFHAKKVAYIPGVGIDVEKFANTSSTIDRDKKRQELNIDGDTILLLSVGELNANKNHSIVIKALGDITRKYENLPKIVYAIAGSGPKAEELKQLAANNGVDLQLLGYRNDISELLTAADLFILPSLREGLNVSLMEAMASGTPCICGCIRENTDLIDGKGGELCDTSDQHSVEKAILKEFDRKSNWGEEGKYNQKKILNYDVSNVISEYSKIGGVPREVVFDFERNIDISNYGYLMEIYERQKIRKEFDIKNSDVVLISVGELSKRKNQIEVLKALRTIVQKKKYCGKVKYLLVGQGKKEKEYRNYVKKNDLSNNVIFLGYRSDVPKLLNASDLFVFPSLQEGLPVALMEAMAMEKPCICSNIRGNRDLIDEQGGKLIDPNSIISIQEAIKYEIDNREEWKKQGNHNRDKLKNYTIELVISEYKNFVIEAEQ